MRKDIGTCVWVYSNAQPDGDDISDDTKHTRMCVSNSKRSFEVLVGCWLETTPEMLGMAFWTVRTLQNLGCNPRTCVCVYYTAPVYQNVHQRYVSTWRLWYHNRRVFRVAAHVVNMRAHAVRRSEVRGWDVLMLNVDCSFFPQPTTTTSTQSTNDVANVREYWTIRTAIECENYARRVLFFDAIFCLVFCIFCGKYEQTKNTI